MPNPRNPKIKVIDVAEDQMIFDLYDTDLSMANALRRIMIAEVPTLMIETIEFEENSTALQDEIIAHRIGLIPLKSRKRMSEWNFNHACVCDSYCERCSVNLYCDVTYEQLAEESYGGDQQEYAETGFPIIISSKQLKSELPDEVDVVHFDNEDYQRSAQDDGIAIIQIGPGQKLKFRCKAIKGVGKEHAKWSPVATVALKLEPTVKLDEDILSDFNEDDLRQIEESCPVSVFKYDDNIQSLLLDNPSNCMFCKECIHVSQDLRKKPEDPLAVEIIHSEDKFRFTVETIGSLTPKEVVEDALEVLELKIKKIKSAVQNNIL